MRKQCMLGLIVLVVMLLLFSTGCSHDNPLVAGKPIVFVPEQLRSEAPLKISLVWFGTDFRLDLLQWQGEHPNAVICEIIPPWDTSGYVFGKEWVHIVYQEH